MTDESGLLPAGSSYYRWPTAETNLKFYRIAPLVRIFTGVRQRPCDLPFL